MELSDWIPPHVEKTNEPFFVIKLQDESSIPKVFYKGKEVIYKRNVYFNWDTKTDVSEGGLTYGIEHREEEGWTRTERRLRDHAD